MRPAVSGTIGPTGNSEDIECGQQTGEYAVAFFMRQSPRLLLGERAVPRHQRSQGLERQREEALQALDRPLARR